LSAYSRSVSCKSKPEEANMASTNIWLNSVCLVSLIRLAILIKAQASPDPDFTSTGTTLTYWTVIEVHTGIVVACLMTLKPLVAKLFPGLLDPPQTKDGTSGARSGPPLTVGSKPTRLPHDAQHHESWFEVDGHNETGEVMLRDVEAEAGEQSQTPPRPGDTQLTLNNDEDTIIVEPKLPPSPFRPNDDSSDRTEDLEPEAKARSIG
jgi:hypothetical protein